MRALTGPAAAALLGFDGFRDAPGKTSTAELWTPLWTSPSTHRAAPHLIRTRHWLSPTFVDVQQVAHPALILRHLGEGLADTGFQNRLKPLELVELAVEFALRHELVSVHQLAVRSSRLRGDRLLSQVMRMRGNQPATESFAETRAVQILRGWGISCWRQVWIYEHGRPKHRVDLVIPFKQRMARPAKLTPGMGLLLEVDSREFHERQFEKDHARQTTYDLLGFEWISFTPNQLEHQENRCRKALEVRIERGSGTTQLRNPRQKSIKSAIV
jgi:hypothetical protein